jgi:membrane protein
MLQWWEEFSKRPWVAHILRTVERFNVRGGGLFAAAVAYFSVLSLVPVLMMAFSVLGMVLTVFDPPLLEALGSRLTDSLDAYGDLGQKLLLPLIRKALSDWAAILGFGLVLGFWTGANWIGNLKRACRALMREDYDNPPKQLILPLDVLVNFVALLMLFVGVAVSWAASTVATVLGREVGQWLGVSGHLGWSLLIRGVGLLLSLAVATLLFWWMFRWFALTPVPARLLWIGALVGAVPLVLLQTLAGYLIGFFTNNPSAALFGPVIILMIFLNLFATLILYVAAWLATAHPEPAVESAEDEAPEPEPAESRPGELTVSSTVAEKSMGVGLATGYTVGTATGIGLGALLAALLGWAAGRKD